MSSYPELDQIENALASAAARLAGHAAPRAVRRRSALVAAVALALLVGGVALAGATGTGPLAGRLDGIFGSDGAPPAPVVVPASADELRHDLGVADSHGGRVLVPAGATTGHLAVYAYAKDGRVCLVVAGTGSIGHCESTLSEAAGHLSVDLGVVDGEAFVWGLADDDVIRVTVTIAGHDYPVTLGHNAYVAALPDQAVASQPITVTAHLADGTTRVQRSPGLPAPIAHPVAVTTTP